MLIALAWSQTRILSTAKMFLISALVHFFSHLKSVFFFLTISILLILDVYQNSHRLQHNVAKNMTSTYLAAFYSSLSLFLTTPDGHTGFMNCLA